MLWLLLLPLLTWSVTPACDMSLNGDDLCAEFCSGQCSFYNASAGEKGLPQNLTVWRITPTNVTGLVDKNTADAPGDITFVISKKNLTQQCVHDPKAMGCNTDVESKDMYGEFVIEVDGQWGPYSECNPADGWDTKDWFCGQECIHPTHEGCGEPYQKKNGTGFGGPQCWCDRAYNTVGRERAPGSTGQIFSDMPASYPPQCAGGFLPLSDDPTGCIAGEAYKKMLAWSFASAASMGCQACYADDRCTGWRSLDNRTVELFDTPLQNISAKGCVGARRHHSRFGGSNWFGIVSLGGCESPNGCSNVWYSTTSASQCPPGKPLGTNGCSWRLVETTKYANATCVDAKADAAIEKHGAVCFDDCPVPLNKTTDCYLDCYRNTLMGDASQNLSAVPSEAVVDPWVRAFREDPANGGCPPLKFP